MRGEIDLKGRGQEKQHRDVCGGPFIKKRLIKENNFAVWRNGEGGKPEGSRRGRTGNGRALFFLTLSAGTVLKHFEEKHTLLLHYKVQSYVSLVWSLVLSDMRICANTHQFSIQNKDR